MTSEAELVSGCLLHDRVAQRQLYDRYKKAMYTLAYRITGDFDAANDVIQDAFLEVFRHLDQFRGESTLGAWIRQIVVRKSTKKKKVVLWQNVDDYPEESIDWGDHDINAAHLETAILSLPDGFRTIFVLAEVEGYTHREIAVMLNISEGTSKSQLFHAKRKLRGMLTSYGYGHGKK
ncbi:RNA polymerase sigma factor [Dyadobacter sandarakinus]|uniref:RNA polymerase sigma factor n=1 Tax=Dyadobacter sandarakinus TaxID=2747268 RepID=A0ABX7I8L5_9BACT|nr:RNA polymerase sigma factor [Dyadobacter sandarakinus]QRR02439.1 RNA polymerase sigma factor [Dyadobacter sandarakinus]